MRPANRRDLQHHEGRQRQLRHDRAGANQRDQQNGRHQNDEQGQGHLHGRQGGCGQLVLQACVGEGTHDRHVIEVAEPAHAGGVVQRLEPVNRRFLGYDEVRDTHGCREA